MSPTTSSLFSAGIVPSNATRTPTNDRDTEDQLPKNEVFSTATWLVSDGRSARSVASSAHCEDVKGSRLRRTFQSLLGRHSDR